MDVSPRPGRPSSPADPMQIKRFWALILLTLIVAIHLGIGTCYAVLTPIWQVPDEPAHYNYVRSLAEGRGFPILKNGDYDQEYLERLTSDGFPAELSIARLEYEDHQPPLYYLLATPIYLLTNGGVIPLRIFSVVLGAGLLVAAFGTVRTVFPEHPELALMTSGFIAFIPQHLAMTAGVNNDTLAELTVGCTLWALVAYAGGQGNRPSDSATTCHRLWPEPRHRPWGVGLLVGAALLTKTTAYMVAGVAVGAVFLRGHREGRGWPWMAEQLAWMLVPALFLSAPWFIRNGLTYGWRDPLGLAQHKAVVQGQPRSYEWLADYGWIGLGRRLVFTTFQSFWGQFGWMAVPMPRRVYQVLAMMSLLLVGGFIVWLGRRRRSLINGRLIHHPISLLALSALLTFLAYGWYNLTFVQHQGRYLYPALIPLATMDALGLDTVTRPFPKRLRLWIWTAIFAGLAGFALVSLFKFAIPNL